MVLPQTAWPTPTTPKVRPNIFILLLQSDRLRDTIIYMPYWRSSARVQRHVLFCIVVASESVYVKAWRFGNLDYLMIKSVSKICILISHHYIV